MPSRAQSRVTQYRQQHLPLPVDKSNELVRARIDVENSALVNKLFHLLIAELDPEAYPTVEVNAKELCNGPLNGRQYKDVKEACRVLGKAQIEKVYYETGSMPDFDFDNIFHKIRYRSGKIVAKFVDDMKPHLLELKGRFTRLNYFELVELPSYYSQRVYEILKSWASEGVTEEISLEDFYEMISLPKELRKNFANVRRKVLEKAALDIHKKTSLSYEYKPIYQGKKVVGIQFTIGAKGQAIEAQRGRAATDEAAAKATAGRQRLIKESSACRKQKGLQAGQICNSMNQKKALCKFCRDDCGMLPPGLPLLPPATKEEKIAESVRKQNEATRKKAEARRKEMADWYELRRAHSHGRLP